MAKKHFVDNKWLQERFLEYAPTKAAALAEGKVPPPLPDDILEAAWKIANNFINHKKFRYNPEDVKGDMIVDGLILVLKYGHNYDPYKYKNPFAYFTRIIESGFLQRAARENRQKNIRRKLLGDVTSGFYSTMPDGSITYVGDMPAIEDRRRFNEEADKFNESYSTPKPKKPKKNAKKGLEEFF